MPPAPGSMSASSRTNTADGRKTTTIATSHSNRLASPNWLAAVVSQRSPTIAVMLNSTTSESRRTRGSRLGGWGMHGGGDPPDAAAQHRAARHVGGEMLAARHAQHGDAHRPGVQQDRIPGAVRQLLPLGDDEIRRRPGERERGVPRGDRLAVLPPPPPRPPIPPQTP